MRIQQIMFSNCTDPKRELEFNRWYTHTHLPDLAKTPGFKSARRFFNALPNQGAAQYMAVYEFQADSAEIVLRDLAQLALEAFALGRHIDCIEGVTAGNSPLGSQWCEINPASLEPLTCHDYPPAPLNVRKQMLLMIDMLGHEGKFSALMQRRSIHWLMKLGALWARTKRLF
jgi:hypothetical protein